MERRVGRVIVGGGGRGEEWGGILAEKRQILITSAGATVIKTTSSLKFQRILAIRVPAESLGVILIPHINLKLRHNSSAALSRGNVRLR